MGYRTLNNLDPKLQRAAHKLMLFQTQRVHKFRKLYNPTESPPLFSDSPLKLLGISYTQGIKQLCKGAHARIEDHGTQWVLVSKRFKLENNQDKALAYKLASFQNIRIQFKTRICLSVQNAVVQTDVLKYLLRLRGGGLLILEVETAFSFPLLARITRKALKLPHDAHIDTSLILGLRLMGLELTKGRYGRMVMGARLCL